MASHHPARRDRPQATDNPAVGRHDDQCDTAIIRSVASIESGVASIPPTAGAAISQIETILESIVDALHSCRPLEIPLRSRSTNVLRPVRFPSTNEAEVKKFTCLLRILHLSHESLNSGIIITKRNIYYQDPGLFGSQVYVNQLVDDLAFTLGTGRDALNIVATPRGVMAGNVLIKAVHGVTVYCHTDKKGTPIPQLGEILEVNVHSAKWVLVVEKEATFRSLVAANYHDRSQAGQGIIITAKGYPDLVTRQFLHLLSVRFPYLTLLALVDFDPDGLAIMRTYKCGSKGLHHEQNTCAPTLLWLGPKSGDVLYQSSRSRSPALRMSSPSSPQIEGNHLALDEAGSEKGNFRDEWITKTGKVMPLTRADRAKAMRMLETLSRSVDSSLDDTDLQRELQLMLMLDIKAEIQAVDQDGDVTAWLDARLLLAGL